ncbi:MAG: D-glycero-beta-D-manno-heptose 1-phosphate adenylyltransferase [Chitinophagaceae bacterium]|nr:D-glycero-beta-D-manno-heptose 1-phosphate adenylyltransferase [Chitinophagaceae bacterium]
MAPIDDIEKNIFTLEQLQKEVAARKDAGQKIAFTNGVFDILHQGHIFSLTEAAAQADYLIVAINADVSVKRLKGKQRPINAQNARALVVAALRMVDAVIIFEEDTPLQLITTLWPDVLIKGGDYSIEQIAGAKEVIAHGGRVIINPIVEGFSTSSIIRAMQEK